MKRENMDKSKLREEEFREERLSRLKSRTGENEKTHKTASEPNASEKTREEESDTSEGSNVTASHAQYIRDYRTRQQRKIAKGRQKNEERRYK
jgi:hypothetical protein